MQEANNQGGVQVGELHIVGQGPETIEAFVQNMPPIHMLLIIRERLRTEAEDLDRMPGDSDHTEVRRNNTEVKVVV